MRAPDYPELTAGGDPALVVAVTDPAGSRSACVASHRAACQTFRKVLLTATFPSRIR